MKNTLMLSAAAATALTGSAVAVNIANTGTGIIGVHNTIDATLGTPYVRGDQDVGVLTDGVYAANGSFIGAAPDPMAPDLVDTWNASTVAPALELTYIGINGFIIPAGEEVTNVTVQLVTANDGGWFGTPGVDSTLAAFLEVPTLQTTSDGGTTWTDLANTNDYLTVIENAALGTAGAPNYNTVSFNFAGQTGIDGIRLIGSNAGSADGGFAGAAEFEVNTTRVPEPSSAALFGLAGLALLLRKRR